MTDSKRKRHSPAFKGQVALAAYKGDKTTSQLTSEYGIAATQISQWKSHLVKQAAELFGKTKPAVNLDSLTAPLYEEIGRLKIELDWLKKKTALIG